MPFQLSNISAASNGLTVPYAMAQLPDGSLLVTQRDMFILTHIDTQGVHHDIQIPYLGLDGTDGGLLGVCIDPAYHVNQTIYLAMTTDFQGNDLTTDGNQVFKCQFDQINNVVTVGAVMTTWGSAATGNGGILKISPDGKLFVLTGCGGAAVSGKAQDLSSNNGKILRINLDGSIPNDNPFGTLVWSFGHNLPTGICWQGNYCWAMEKGATGNDRINLIVPGQNYGYPITTNQSVPVLDANANLTIAPALLSGDNETFNPGGIAASPSKLFWGAMGTPYGSSPPTGTPCIGSTLVTGTSLSRRVINYPNMFGRIRDVISGQDGSLYFCTSNCDSVENLPVGLDFIYRIAAP